MARASTAANIAAAMPTSKLVFIALGSRRCDAAKAPDAAKTGAGATGAGCVDLAL
jgi:hypothetical protein